MPSILLFCFVLLATATSQAFNKERCGSLFPKSDGDHPYYYSPIYISTMFPSTTSYFSSIGPCSMYGEYEGGSRSAFIEKAEPSLRIEAARGQGEYLNALATLTGCPTEYQSRVASVMHREFETVFASPSSGGPDLTSRIDAALTADESLKAACRGLN